MAQARSPFTSRGPGARRSQRELGRADLQHGWTLDAGDPIGLTLTPRAPVVRVSGWSRPPSGPRVAC